MELWTVTVAMWDSEEQKPVTYEFAAPAVDEKAARGLASDFAYAVSTATQYRMKFAKDWDALVNPRLTRRSRQGEESDGVDQ